MTTEYICMNKEENRVLIEVDSLKALLSGDLSISIPSYNSCIKPLSIKPSLFTRIRVWWHDLVIVSVNINNFERSSMNDYDYLWLRMRKTGVVYRVWNGFCKSKPNNCSLLDRSGIVIIKGIGSYRCSDFEVFDWDGE